MTASLASQQLAQVVVSQVGEDAKLLIGQWAHSERRTVLRCGAASGRRRGWPERHGRCAPPSAHPARSDMAGGPPHPHGPPGANPAPLQRANTRGKLLWRVAEFTAVQPHADELVAKWQACPAFQSRNSLRWRRKHRISEAFTPSFCPASTQARCSPALPWPWARRVRCVSVGQKTIQHVPRCRPRHAK